MIVIYTQSCCTYRLIGPREILSLLSLFVVLVRLFPCVQTRFTSIHCPVRNDNTVSMCRNTLLHSGIKSSGETIDLRPANHHFDISRPSSGFPCSDYKVCHATVLHTNSLYRSWHSTRGTSWEKLV